MYLKVLHIVCIQLSYALICVNKNVEYKLIMSAEWTKTVVDKLTAMNWAQRCQMVSFLCSIAALCRDDPPCTLNVFDFQSFSEQQVYVDSTIAATELYTVIISN